MAGCLGSDKNGVKQMVQHSLNPAAIQPIDYLIQNSMDAVILSLGEDMYHGWRWCPMLTFWLHHPVSAIIMRLLHNFVQANFDPLRYSLLGNQLMIMRFIIQSLARRAHEVWSVLAQ